MNYLDITLDHYGWAGTTLALLFILLLSIQLFYYIFRFRRVGTYYNNHSRQKVHEEAPSVSVVIPMFSEDYTFIENTLPLIMSQEAVSFEVIIVYVGSDNDFYEDILRLKQVLGNITLTKIERNDRFPISIKTALNVGIKAARNEHVVFTTTDSRPASDRWLSLMAKGFQRGDIVLGYCAMESESGFWPQFIRLSRLSDSMNWLSSAVSGKPYRAIRSNMGFTKTLYFNAKGFNHLNMNIGEDDLFMQSIMSRANTSIILSPRATVVQKMWGGGAWWIDTLRYYNSSLSLYPLQAKNFVGWEFTSRILYFITFIAAMVLFPLELKLAVLILFHLRMIVMGSAVKCVAKRVGEDKIAIKYILFDIFNPLFMLYLRIVMLKKDKRVWR